MIPMKEVTTNPTGMVINWDQKASRGFRANREKSGSLTIRVAKFAMDDMIPETIAQPKAPPDLVPPWCTIGPIPCALTITHIKKATPATGTKKALTVKRWRILWTGNQMAGKLQKQNRKKLRKS